MKNRPLVEQNLREAQKQGWLHFKGWQTTYDDYPLVYERSWLQGKEFVQRMLIISEVMPPGVEPTDIRLRNAPAPSTEDVRYLPGSPEQAAQALGARRGDLWL
jgi:hypothetical protein